MKLSTNASMLAVADVRVGAQHRGDVAGCRDQQHPEGARDRRDQDARAHPPLAQPGQGGGCRGPAHLHPGGRRHHGAHATTAVVDSFRGDDADRSAPARKRACTPRSPRRSAGACRPRSCRHRAGSRGRRGSPRSGRGSPSRSTDRARGSRSARSPSTSRPLRESRLPVGSSAKTRSGAVASARAIATRCCWPPLSWCGRCRSRGPSPSVSTRPSMRARSSALGRRPSRSNGSRMLPSASRVGTRLNAWKTKPDAPAAQDRELEVGERR